MVNNDDPGLSTMQESGQHNSFVDIDLRDLFRLLLFQTRLYNLPKALLALASLSSTYLYILASDAITHLKVAF